MKAYRNTADLFLIVAAVVILAGAWAYFTGTAGATSEREYPNPCYLVCNDPLLTNVTLANTCGQGNTQPAKEKPVESLPVAYSTPVEPTVTQTPNTPVPTDTPVIIDNGGEIIPTVTPMPETPSVPEQPETCSKGNPGNKKCVGNAGEDPNGRGTMDNDSADGNGEHGNQGEGGKKDK